MGEIGYRELHTDEVAQLERQGNRASHWGEVHVSDTFDANLLWNNVFEGDVWIDGPRAGTIEAAGVSLPIGISGSRLRRCKVGRGCAIHDVHLLDGYEIGAGCILFNIGELRGNSEIQWLSPMNENGGRAILATPSMTVGDAFLWARYRGQKGLLNHLEAIAKADLAQEPLPQIGAAAVIKNTTCICNVRVQSSAEAPTIIEQCVTLADGVIGYGSYLRDGVMARRFLLGQNVHLEDGLRLNDTVVGDNSTLARCEVGCSMIFPAHEQHHNNSFLIAALIEGQSNLAAGATVGSNHNSRTADGELQACRGFWPGLCTSLKHNSKFAAYCLLAKGDYPAELNIPLPFALVNNNTANNCLEILPAYWWLYNMYALQRKQQKLKERDHRPYKTTQIDTDFLAPDTAEQMLQARRLLSVWISRAGHGAPVLAEGVEHSRRPVVILKAKEGLAAYEQMMYCYVMNTLSAAYGSEAEALLQAAQQQSTPPYRETQWENIGGQLLPYSKVAALLNDIESGQLKSWQEIHERLRTYADNSMEDRLQHAWAVLYELRGNIPTTLKDWQMLLHQYHDILQYVSTQTKKSRAKDDENPFRQATYYNEEERLAVLG